MKKSDSELPILPPLDFDPPSNGEFCPLPPTELAAQRHQLWRGIVEEQHRRLGMSRRQFAESACGTAAWLYTMGQLVACSDGKQAMTSASDASDARGYDVPAQATGDMAMARELLQHDPFVFDVQTHVSDVEITPWPAGDPPQKVLDFFKEIFVRSGTSVACVSGVPATRGLGLANVQARSLLREMID